MRICYIANAAYNLHFARWYNYFLEKGHEVHVVSGDPSRVTHEVTIPGITVHYLPEEKLKSHVLSFGYNLLKLPLIIWELRRILKKISHDIVHAHQVYAEGMWAALADFHPFIVTPIGSDLLIHTHESFVLRIISNYVLRKADLITCDSVVLQDEIFRFGGTPDKTHLIFNGIDFSMFHSLVDSSVIRNKYKIGNSPLVLSVRNLDAVYNIDSVIKSIPAVLKFIPDAKFIFCYIETSVDQLNPHKLVNELGLEGSVILAGTIPREDMPCYYAAADVCISVPSSDSSPNSVYESMACGTPVIVSDVPWTKHFMKDRQNCLMIPARDSGAISDAIIEILKNEHLRNRLAENAHSTVKRYVDYYINMEKLASLMDGLKRVS